MHRQPRAPKDSVLRSEMLSGQSESLDDQVRAFGDGHLGQQLDVVIERRVSREEALELLRRFLETMAAIGVRDIDFRSEEHTSELQSLMRISYAVFCLKKKN